jgi:transmembrane sensor
MMTPDDHDFPLLDRVLAGDATADEVARVEAWAAEEPGRTALLAGVRQAVTSGTPVNTDRSWQALAARMDAAEAAPVVRSITTARSRRPSVVPRWGIAAAAVVVAVGASTYWRSTGITTLEAPIGQRISATLPDGSTIQLSAGSRASWSRTFGAAARDVQLEGEAYFDVVHDSAKPFRVRAGDGVAEDVGTRFVVRAWPELRGVEVAVEEGIVALTDSGTARTTRGTLLRAGARGVLTGGGKVTVSDDAGPALAWVRGELEFDNAPLSEALPAIGRWYGVVITPDPMMRDRRLTARFAQQPLEQLLDALGLALGARVTRDGSTITLSPD